MTDQYNCDQSISLRAELDNERKRYQEACGERDAARVKAVEMARRWQSVDGKIVANLGYAPLYCTDYVLMSKQAADIIEQWGSK